MAVMEYQMMGLARLVLTDAKGDAICARAVGFRYAIVTRAMRLAGRARKGKHRGMGHLDALSILCCVILRYEADIVYKACSVGLHLD